jgi:hypothetical protein
MTKEELAATLNGRQYRNEITDAEAKVAKDNGLVVVFGGSDDLMYLSGAASDELPSYEGTTIFFTSDGHLVSECDDDACPYFTKLLDKATAIAAVWDSEGYSWTYTTDIPHVTFEIMLDDEKYCRGIVFALADAKDTGHE